MNVASEDFKQKNAEWEQEASQVMPRSVGDIWQRAFKEMGTLGCRVMAGLRSKLKKQEASLQSKAGGLPSSMYQAGQENVWSASLTEQ